MRFPRELLTCKCLRDVRCAISQESSHLILSRLCSGAAYLLVRSFRGNPACEKFSRKYHISHLTGDPQGIVSEGISHSTSHKRLHLRSCPGNLASHVAQAPACEKFPRKYHISHLTGILRALRGGGEEPQRNSSVPLSVANCVVLK